MPTSELIKPIKEGSPYDDNSPQAVRRKFRRRKYIIPFITIVGGITQALGANNENPISGIIISADKAPAQPSAPKGKILPSAFAQQDIPPAMLSVYIQSADSKSNMDWTDVASLGKMESDHGRSPLQGVKSGLNSANCCAGPLQFNVITKEGVDQKTTWERWGGDFNKDGKVDVYDYRDAIPAATNLFSHLVGKFHDKVLAAAAYNAGETNVMDSGGVPPISETQKYVANFTMYQSKYKG